MDGKSIVTKFGFFIKPNLKLLTFFSRFTSTLARHPQGENFCAQYQFYEGVYDPNTPIEEIKNEELDDLIRGAIFCSTDDMKDSDGKRTVADFITAYNISKEIHELRLALEAKGHPEFQGTILTVPFCRFLCFGC
jgi:hypothetical protein